MDEASIVEQWLFGRSAHTVRAYRDDSDRFRRFCTKPLAEVSLIDLQRFADSLNHLAPASKARTLASIKSYFTFAEQQGVITHNPSRALKLPRYKDKLAERILTEKEVLVLINGEPNPKRRALLTFLYASGVRVSEAAGLTWRCLSPKDNGEGHATIFGKGGKTRTTVLPSAVFEEMLRLRGEAEANDLVFGLSSSSIWRTVRGAAARVGLFGVSPHFLRHCHASHALEHGAPIDLVQATLGHSSLATTGRYLHARPGASSGSFLRLDSNLEQFRPKA